MSEFSPSDLSDYQENGFLIARSLFSSEEIDLLGETARADNAMDKSSSSRDDGEGNAVRLALWNHPGDGIYGMFARSKRLVNRVEQLLEDEAYHYHSKMVLRTRKWEEPGPGIRIMVTGIKMEYLLQTLQCMIAVDKATVENGCMQVIRSIPQTWSGKSCAYRRSGWCRYGTGRRSQEETRTIHNSWIRGMHCSFIPILYMHLRK